MSLIRAPLQSEDPRLKLQQVLRIIRRQLVRDRSSLSDREQRLLIAMVVAEVELGRHFPVFTRIERALEMAVTWNDLGDYARRGRTLLQRVLVD